MSRIAQRGQLVVYLVLDALLLAAHFDDAEVPMQALR